MRVQQRLVPPLLYGARQDLELARHFFHGDQSSGPESREAIFEIVSIAEARTTIVRSNSLPSPQRSPFSLRIEAISHSVFVFNDRFRRSRPASFSATQQRIAATAR
jgi:hypothetical protein